MTSIQNGGRPGAVATALVVLALLAAGCNRSPREAGPPPTTSTTTTAASLPAGCATSTAARPPAGGSSGSLTFGGIERLYLLHVPAGYDATEPTPVVFNFHGHGSSAAAEMAYADFRPLAERETFLVVAPEGQGSPRRFTLLGATATEADDAGFAVALLDHLAAEVCIDDRRVFATGMSNGGALSSVLACRASDRFAAVGAVAAMIFVPPCAEGGRPAPIVAMMGDADPVVPYAGGRVNCCGNPNIPAAPDTLAGFARRSNCDEPPEERRPKPTIAHRVWKGCDEGTAVELFTIEGGGHTWPGASFDLASRGLGVTTQELIATETIWAFFEAHPLPPT